MPADWNPGQDRILPRARERATGTPLWPDEPEYRGYHGDRRAPVPPRERAQQYAADQQVPRAKRARQRDLWPGSE